MEHKLKDLIHQETSLPNSSDPYAHIELSPEEIESLLRKARQEKAAMINSRNYLEKLSTPKQYPKYTLADFKEAVLIKIRRVIPDYVLDKYNSHIFHLLALYGIGDPEFEKIDNGAYSLKKGIALFGKIGVGKTSIAAGFGVNPVNSYSGISCRTVATEYAHKEFGGSLTIQKYSGPREVPPFDYFGQKFVGTLFDDLGTEGVKKHFGNESNVMQDIILNRYDNPSLVGKTHLTTNLNSDEIGEIYGDRVRSRLRQMCNILIFDPAGGDRRK